MNNLNEMYPNFLKDNHPDSPHKLSDLILEGKKFDKEKLRVDLLPPDALEEIAKVLTFGAQKYGDRNWEYGMKWSRPYGAILRHLWAWWKGEDIDPESGISHLGHAGCNILFLITYHLRKVGMDNRPL